MGTCSVRREFENGGLEPLGPRERAQKFWKNYFWNFLKNNVLKILTWWVGAALEIGIFCCAMLVQLSSMLLALGHLVKTTTVSDGRLCVCVCVWWWREAMWFVVIRNYPIGGAYRIENNKTREWMKINHDSFYSKQNRLVTVMYIMANVVQFSTKHLRPWFYLHTPSGWSV